MAVKMEGASPPVFEQIFRNARFAQGGNALFEGKVAGSPRPQVSYTICLFFLRNLIVNIMISTLATVNNVDNKSYPREYLYIKP